MSDMYDYDPLEPFSEDEFVTYNKRELRNLDAGREEWDDGDDKDNKRYEKIDNRDPDDDYDTDDEEPDDNFDDDDEEEEDNPGEDDYDEDEPEDTYEPGGMRLCNPVKPHQAISTGIAALPLFTAIINGKLDEVRSLLSNNPKWVNAKDGKGLTSLHYAVAIDNIAIVKYLLNCKAKVDVKNNAGFTPLDIAKTRGNTALIEYLKCVSTLPALFYAIEKQQLAMVARLLKDNPQIIIANDEHGRTPIHYAAELDNSNTGILQQLLDCGSDVNVKNSQNGCTPLHYAINNRGIGSFIFLVSNGADINTKDNNGISPLRQAIRDDRIEIVKRLIELGADVNEIDASGKSLYSLAMDGYDESLVDMLTEYGAIPFENIFEAITDGTVDDVRIFIERNVEVNVRDDDGWTPLHLAAEKGNVEIVKYLVSQKAKLNAKDNNRLTPFLLAKDNEYDDVTEYLLSVGADDTDPDTDSYYDYEYKDCPSCGNMVKCRANGNLARCRKCGTKF